MTTCTLYLRLSDGRHENGSFPEREARLRQRAAQLGWTVRNVVTENDLVTGGKRSASAFKRRTVTLPDGSKVQRVVRPGFRAILDDLAAGVIQAFLSEDLDRACRDPRDLEDLIDVVGQCRGYADSLTGSLRFTAGGTDAEITLARLMVAIAWKASADTRRRVADGRARTAAAGRNGGARRPYGFNRDGLTVNQAEAEEIRAAVDKLLAGVSLASITLDLNEREVPNATGTRWTAQSLRDVLLKPRNAGRLVHTDYRTGKTEVAAMLPGEPILPEEVWLTVVAKLTDPGRISPGGRAPRWLGVNDYRCICGAPMEVQGGVGRRPRYACSMRPRPAGTVHTSRDAIKLDEYVGVLVVERLSRPDAAGLVVVAPAGVDVNELRAEQATLRQRKADLAAAFAEGEIDRAMLKAGTERIEDKLTKVDYELSMQVGRSPLTPLINADDVAAAWEGMSVGEKRAVVRDLMTVTVLPTRPGFKGKGFDPEAIRVEPR